MSDGTLTVRHYEPEDADAVVAVHEAAFRASDMPFVEEAAVDEVLQNVTETYLDGSHTFLVGTVDGDVVATGGYRTRGDAVAEVGHLRVRPDHQRRGYARRLMNALEERAREAGIETFVLETHEDLTAARQLYETIGYHLDHTEAHPVTGDTMFHYRTSL